MSGTKRSSKSRVGGSFSSESYGNVSDKIRASRAMFATGTANAGQNMMNVKSSPATTPNLDRFTALEEKKKQLEERKKQLEQQRKLIDEQNQADARNRLELERQKELQAQQNKKLEEAKWQEERERAQQVDREKNLQLGRAQQAERERAQQAERERAQQTERERAQQAERERAQQAERERSQQDNEKKRPLELQAQYQRQEEERKRQLEEKKLQEEARLKSLQEKKLKEQRERQQEEERRRQEQARAQPKPATIQTHERIKEEPVKATSEPRIKAPITTGGGRSLGTLFEQRMKEKEEAEHNEDRERIRARRANGVKHVDNEVRRLIAEIKALSATKGRPAPSGVAGALCPSVTFGDLFKECVARMSELSATLATAQKRKVVVYSGVMLAQGFDDDVLITLIKDQIRDSDVYKSKIISRPSTANSMAPTPCARCGKTVFQTERLPVNQLVFHKTCFKCSTCNKTLKLGDYSFVDSKYFCKPCFMTAFNKSGGLNFK
eukprot:TRINITY_DN3687_c0_g1_i1.p1 TRINITY_DN3687_c0_g1~~TRINITY_DN3687_c0_g1_i1.p1  ORF type:complete len:496 (-),score=116.06 TRINITY_DN3687_c0_g1_i1:16-1503(-)